ncbi:thioredoxin-like protein [Cristinia sonorae]|uniref:Thioredoxin-like protein n=1 Tax=Cristinia sonorae TaxID=1940300 RepID=A0A8K0URT0_9AGAR|nr:thioredoxin-like protein [Cristinia sonorae]
MFSAFKRSIPQISIFHRTSSPPSQMALRILQGALSSPYPPYAHTEHPLEFNLEVIEDRPPTPDQIRTILSYTNASSPDTLLYPYSGSLSQGKDRTPEEVTSLVQQNPKVLKWPIVVDWDGGRAAVGDLEGVKNILENLGKQRDGQ